MFIETHAHIYEEDYAQDIDLVISRAREAGCQKILLPPTDEASTIKALQLSAQFPELCYPMIGLHPEDVKEDYLEVLQRMELLLKAERQRFVAIGEVGLDYYWDKQHKEEQKAAFDIQINWAVSYDLPLMIHSRSDGGDLLACLRPWREKLKRGGVFHCFSGSIQQAQELLRFHPNFCLGIGGIITFKNSRLPEVIKNIPLERIVLETDSPYMAPVPMRGKRNEPSFISHIIASIAKAKGVETYEVERITTANALALFFNQDDRENAD